MRTISSVWKFLKNLAFHATSRRSPNAEKKTAREKRLSTNSLLFSMAVNCTLVRPLAAGLGVPHLYRSAARPALV